MTWRWRRSGCSPGWRLRRPSPRRDAGSDTAGAAHRVRPVGRYRRGERTAPAEVVAALRSGTRRYIRRREGAGRRHECGYPLDAAATLGLEPGHEVDVDG